MRIETVQTLGPELAITRDPGFRFGQRRHNEAAGATRSLTSSLNESGALENEQMLGNGGKGLIEWRREIAYGRLPFAQFREYRPARRVCQRGKRLTESIAMHATFNQSVEYSFRAKQMTTTAENLK